MGAGREAEWTLRCLAKESLRQMSTPAQTIRDHEEEILWCDLGESRLPKKDSDPWRPGSPLVEAAALVKLIGRNGDDVESLRALIGVSDAELAELREWAASSSPVIAVGIENMIRFRAQVALEFERLVRSKTPFCQAS